MKRATADLLAAAWCTIFVALGWLLLPYPGFQADEVLFASPLFAPTAWVARVRMFHTDLPTMIMSYIGALKSYLYQALFHFFDPTVVTVRLPMLLLTAVTIWLVYRTLARTAGARPALIAAILLATDPVFTMTSVFDWGPVAIQHFLLAAALLGFVVFYQGKSLPALGLATFALGLGVWDKISFAWLLAGLVCAAAVAFPKVIRAALRPRTITTAAIPFLLGALPLLIYNYQHRGATMQVGAGITITEFQAKYQSLRDVMRGSGLYDYLANEDPTQPARTPRNAIERTSMAIHGALGHTRGNLGSAAFMFAVAMTVIRWRESRCLKFFLIFIVVSWLAMLLVKGAGGSVHHTILLWPAIPMLIALAIAQGADLAGEYRRVAGPALLTVLVAGNLIVYNEYLYAFVRNGSRAAWTDAIGPLARRVVDQHPSRVCLADWGMINQLRILGRGSIAINDVSFTLLSDAQDARALDGCLADPVILTHVPALEEFKGSREKLDKFAQTRGLAPQRLELVSDALGRPVFEIFRYTPSKIQ